MIKSKFKSTMQSSVLFLFLTLSLSPGTSVAQNRTTLPMQTKTLSGKEWSKSPEISQQFMQGCIGKKSKNQNQIITKQNYCQCALNAYQVRYNPELFSRINAYVVKIGKDSPMLVSLMMNPELNQCIAKTGYQP